MCQKYSCTVRSIIGLQHSGRNVGGGGNGNGNNNGNKDDGDSDSGNDDNNDSGGGRRATAAAEGMVWGRCQMAGGSGNQNKVEMRTMWI